MTVFFPLFSSYPFRKFCSYLKLSVKGVEEKNEEIFEMECILIKYSIPLLALRKGDNFCLTCNLYAKVWSKNICIENSCWNKETNHFLRAEKMYSLSKALNISFISMHQKMPLTKYLECYQSLAFNSSLF